MLSKRDLTCFSKIWCAKSIEVGHWVGISLSPMSQAFPTFGTTRCRRTASCWLRMGTLRRTMKAQARLRHRWDEAASAGAGLLNFSCNDTWMTWENSKNYGYDMSWPLHQGCSPSWRQKLPMARWLLSGQVDDWGTRNAMAGTLNWSFWFGTRWIAGWRMPSNLIIGTSIRRSGLWVQVFTAQVRSASEPTSLTLGRVGNWMTLRFLATKCSKDLSTQGTCWTCTTKWISRNLKPDDQNQYSYLARKGPKGDQNMVRRVSDFWDTHMATSLWQRFSQQHAQHCSTVRISTGTVTSSSCSSPWSFRQGLILIDCWKTNSCFPFH